MRKITAIKNGRIWGTAWLDLPYPSNPDPVPQILCVFLVLYPRNFLKDKLGSFRFHLSYRFRSTLITGQ